MAIELTVPLQPPQTVMSNYSRNSTTMLKRLEYRAMPIWLWTGPSFIFELVLPTMQSRF